MTIEQAIATLHAMDKSSRGRFTEPEREAIQTLGVAGWSGELQPDDARLAELPAVFKDIVRIMQTKRVIQ